MTGYRLKLILIVNNLKLIGYFRPFQIATENYFNLYHKLPQDTKAGKSAYHSFDCSIMDIADDIAYGVHDLEDAIHLRLINPSHLDTPEFRQLLSNTPLTNQTKWFN